MKRFALLLVVLLAPTFLLACPAVDTLPDSRNYSESQEEAARPILGVPVKGTLGSSERAVMEFRASLVPTRTWLSVNSINVVGDESHYGRGYAAHCHDVANGVWLEGDICLKPRFTKDMVIWHEMLHAWHLRLNAAEKKEFDDEWRLIAGDVYGLARPDEKFPSRGLLRGYSGKDSEEDVADTFMYVYAAAYGEGTPYSEFRKPEVVAPDRRYKAKVEMLNRYGLLTEEAYRRFTDLDLFRE